jgi:hypothetical protein
VANAADGNVRRIFCDGMRLLPHHELVMPGLVPGIYVLGAAAKVVDGRDSPAMTM